VLLSQPSCAQEEGFEMQCRWCGMGGDIVGCDHCISSYCEGCIKRNLGKKVLTAVKNNDDWHCYSCKPSPIKKLRWENLQERAVCRHLLAPPPARTHRRLTRCFSCAALPGCGGGEKEAKDCRGKEVQVSVC
jgi:hypothetical protein